MSKPLFKIFFMKKNLILTAIFAFFSVLIFDSCSPKISVAAENGDAVKVNFSTSFPEETAKTLRSMAGIGADIPIFAENDIKKLLSEAGAENTKVSIPSANALNSSGEIKNLSQNALSKCGIVAKSEKSLSVSLGPEQFKNFYDLLTDEFKSYFDLMMVPGLIDEKMSVQEYETLLSSMYGPTFAKDVVSGTLEISLSSPDGKKTLKDSVPLGEILTLDETKTWKVSW